MRTFYFEMQEMVDDWAHSFNFSKLFRVLDLGYTVYLYSGYSALDFSSGWPRKKEISNPKS